MIRMPRILVLVFLLQLHTGLDLDGSSLTLMITHDEQSTGYQLLYRKTDYQFGYYCHHAESDEVQAREEGQADEVSVRLRCDKH